MISLRIVSLAALVLALPAISLAQENAPGADGKTQKAAPLQQSGTKGTAPEGAGSTGWTGGTGGSFVGTDHQSADPSWQPEMATGADLKGPPTRFPAGRTPE